jgi:protein required for attachment to host cells
MLLCELFGSGDMIDDLRQQIMDYLTPMVSRDQDSVPIQDIEQAVRSYRTGLSVDRGLIMQILDPTKMKLIKKVEGDKIYLNVAAAMTSKSNPETKEKQEKKISDKATAQAKKAVNMK